MFKPDVARFQFEKVSRNNGDNQQCGDAAQ